MLRIKVICVGKLKEKSYDALCAEYAKRLQAFCRLEIEEISEKALPEGTSEAQKNAALRSEAEEVLSAVPAGAHITALCIEGEQAGSEVFAQRLSLLSQTYSSLCFLIGGSNGLADALKERANAKMSFSKMTFPHHLFRVMFLEQLYRAFSIGAGRAYHK